MIKFKQGWLMNEDGVKKDIVVTSKTCAHPILMLLGGLSIALGIDLLMRASFMKGSEAHEEAEYDTMVDLGIIDPYK